MAETVRRGEKVVVKCQAFGDRPITITWKKDGQLLDKQAEKKYTIDETMTDEGITSEVHIQSADRRDSSLFTCLAENSFGKDEMNIQIIVQEKPDKPFKLTAMKVQVELFHSPGHRHTLETVLFLNIRYNISRDQ
ncbi:down syndrome cell adhesion molecule-like protein 1-like protein, partial [Trichonephila clavata]